MVEVIDTSSENNEIFPYVNKNSSVSISENRKKQCIDLVDSSDEEIDYSKKTQTKKIKEKIKLQRKKISTTSKQDEESEFIYQNK